MKILLSGLLFFAAFSVQAEIAIQNKGTSNNCDVKILKAHVTKKLDIRKGHNDRFKYSKRSLSDNEVGVLAMSNFNPILIPSTMYSPSEGDLFIASGIYCEDFGGAFISLKCYGKSTMYLQTNGLSLVVASARGSDGDSYEQAEVGISNLNVSCK